MKSLKYLTALAAVAAFGLTAKATPTLSLYINDTNNFGTAVLEATGTNPGSVNFNGTFDSWTGTIDAGGSTGVSLMDPKMDVHLDGTFSNSGSLWVWLVGTGFGPTPAGGATAVLSSSNDSGVTATQYAFGDGLNIVNGPFNGSFISTAFGSVNASSSYTLTNEIAVQGITGGALVSTDAKLTVPDSGTTALLMGLGLLAIGIATVAQRRTAAQS